MTAAAIEALINVHKNAILLGALLGNIRHLAHAQGGIKALQALQRGAGDSAAKLHHSLGGYQPLASLQTAWAALPVGIENYTLAQVQEFLRSQGIEIATDPVSNGQVNGVQQLEHDELPIVYLDDEHHAAPADLGNGAITHGSSVLQGGAS